ncbi:catalase [Streptomyces thinghirensis]|nr:catalase [Streptomyces thinghirensis]
MADSLGGADAIRDPPRLRAEVLHRRERYDLVGSNTPVFFIKDPIKFPDFIHSQKRDPFSGRQEPDNVFDFWAHSPRGHAPDHLADGRPRHPGVVPPHGRLRLAHLPVDERQGRVLLRQVPLQDGPGHPLPDRRRGREARGRGPDLAPDGPGAGDRARACTRPGRCTCS